MSNRLSHSSVTKFQECGKAWSYHYQEKLRHQFTSSALLFGSALDKALESLLKGEDAYATFDRMWGVQYVNKVQTTLATSPNVVYANSDVQLELINEGQKLAISAKFGTKWEESYKAQIKKKEQYGFKNLNDDERSIINFVAWNSLATKGYLMLDSFVKQVMPKVSKVLATQKEISIKNSEGDEVIGFADAVLEFTDGQVVVVDFKTSTRLYEEESVLTSPQLSLYVFALSEEFKTRKAGYIVLNKRISLNKTKICTKCGFDGSGKSHKTCPDETEGGDRCNGVWEEIINPTVYIQTIIDEIPQQTEDIVMQNIEQINQSIKTGVFVRNFSSCKKPWGLCPYYNKCYKGVDDELIKVE